MKRLFLLAVFAAVVGATAFAQSSHNSGNGKPFHLGANVALGYETLLPGLNIWNFRVGTGLHADYRVLSHLSVGAEADALLGVHKASLLASGYDAVYFDVPVLATVGYQVGKILPQALIGLDFASVSPLSGSTVPKSSSTKPDIGARVVLGGEQGLWLQVSGLLGSSSTFLVAAGLRFNLLSL